jgi:hypothetical protein
MRPRAARRFLGETMLPRRPKKSLPGSVTRTFKYFISKVLAVVHDVLRHHAKHHAMLYMRRNGARIFDGKSL